MIAAIAEGPYIVVLDGSERTFADRRAFAEHVRAINTEIGDRNIELARVRCRMGWAILQFKKAVGHGSLADVYAELRISPRRGQEVCKFAEACANPVTGAMIDSRYRSYARTAKRKARAAGRTLRLDGDGNPGIVPVMAAAGISQTTRYQKDTGKCANVRAFGAGPEGRGARGGSVLDACLAHAPPPADRAAAPTAGCVGARQPELPWHLAESARRLAAAAAGLEARLAAGDADHGFATSVQARIDAILTDIERAGVTA